MSVNEFGKLVDRKYRPAAVFLLSLGAAAWMVVAAISHFQMMVDERAQHVIEAFAAKPLQEHKDFERRISQNEKEIAGLIESARLLDRAVTRLMALREEEDRARRGPPVRTAGPSFGDGKSMLSVSLSLKNQCPLPGLHQETDTDVKTRFSSRSTRQQAV